MITFQDVTVRRGERAILSVVTFTIHPGEFICLTGPSGAGKTTILHLILGAEFPTEGVVAVDGQPLQELSPRFLQWYRRSLGVVFQDGKLLSDRTVASNVAFPMEACGDRRAEIVPRVTELLSRVGLLERASALPEELSGGEQQSVALARALVHHPKVLLADEPTGNLDAAGTREVLRMIHEVNDEGVTVILATHDEQIVEESGGRILRLEAGRLVSDSPPREHQGASTVSPPGAPTAHHILPVPA